MSTLQTFAQSYISGFGAETLRSIERLCHFYPFKAVTTPYTDEERKTYQQEPDRISGQPGQIRTRE